MTFKELAAWHFLLFPGKMKFLSSLCFFFIFLIEESLLYRILSFSVKPQHESDTDIHISPPFWNLLPSSSPTHPSGLTRSPCVSFLSHTANSRWLSVIFGNVSFNVTLSTHLTLPSPPSWHFADKHIAVFSPKSQCKIQIIWIMKCFQSMIEIAVYSICAPQVLIFILFKHF